MQYCHKALSHSEHELSHLLGFFFFLLHAQLSFTPKKKKKTCYGLHFYAFYIIFHGIWHCLFFLLLPTECQVETSKSVCAALLFLNLSHLYIYSFFFLMQEQKGSDC